MTSSSMAILQWVSGGSLLVASARSWNPARFRRSEIEIVDRRVLMVTSRARVHAGGDHHILPVAGVDVVIHHGHQLVYMNWRRYGLHRHHHRRHGRERLLHALCHGDAVEQPSGGSPEIRELLLIRAPKTSFSACSTDDSVRRPRRTWKDRWDSAHVDRRHYREDEVLHRIVIAGVVAIRPFVAIVDRRELVDHDLGRHLEQLADAIGKPGGCPSNPATGIRSASRRTAARMVPGIGANHACRGQRRGLLFAPALMMLPRRWRSMMVWFFDGSACGRCRIVIVLAVRRALGDDQRPGDQQQVHRASRCTGSFDRSMSPAAPFPV